MSMQAIVVRETGGPEVLRREQVSVPEPGPGQVRVRIEASGVNFIDIYQRSGLYRVTLPATLGQEAAGTVDALGEGVEDVHVRPGSRVAWASVLGTYAEYAVVSADRVVPVPPNVSARDAAAALLQGMTAHYLTTSTHALQPGETCLVHAAAGGVGLLLCQMAKKRGARVIGTAGSEEKAELAREAGADHVVVYTEQDFESETMRLTEGEGVRVVYDSVGRTTFDASLRCLAPRGLMVLFGQASGPVAPLDPQLLNQRGSLFLTRPSIGHYTATRAELLARAADVLGWVGDRTLRVRVGLELPLSQAAEAHRRLAARLTTGKVVLIPGS